MLIANHDYIFNEMADRCTIGGMKLLIALYFFVLATIQFGLLLGIYHYYRAQGVLKPSPYWLGSLIASVAGLYLFGISVISVNDVAKPEFSFTIANTLFFLATILQLLFCDSLRGVVPKGIKLSLALSVVVFPLVFEWMRIHGNFEMRTTFVCVLAIFFFSWQIYTLFKKRTSTPSQQLTYVMYVTLVELLFVLGRLSIVIAPVLTIRQVEQIPQLLILLTIFQLVMNTLSYIAIGGYWAEQIAVANTQSEIENHRIKQLLIEREGLVNSLLKVNKTAATGALSASIAHELNQPLGASNLNIQFLQKRLSEGVLTSEQTKEVLAALLSDNQRAATIIRSLRSIFSDGKIGVEQVDINELIDSVLKITNPEIHAQNIQVRFRLDAKTLIHVNRSEIQQVLLNLINNAIQGLSECDKSNKNIQIESRDIADGVEVIVADNGSGIDAQMQSHLFELLAQSSKKTGMGLGLWLCQHIISRHGGVIRYQDAPHGGAQFIFTLPLNQVD